MSYTASIAVVLGSGKSGLAADLRARLVSTLGTTVEDDISSLFVETGNGNYVFTYDLPNAFRGAICFYEASSPSECIAMTVVNPESIESVKDILEDTSHLTSNSYQNSGPTIIRTGEAKPSSTFDFGVSDTEGDGGDSIETGVR